MPKLTYTLTVPVSYVSQRSWPNILFQVTITCGASCQRVAIFPCRVQVTASSHVELELALHKPYQEAGRIRGAGPRFQNPEPLLRSVPFTSGSPLYPSEVSILIAPALPVTSPFGVLV